MTRFGRLAVFCLAALIHCSTDAFASLANRIHQQYSNAIVRISVTGTKANGTRHHPPEVGSGFIVYSDNLRTVVVTAAHVLKPNGYWDVVDGKPQREILVENLNLNRQLTIIANKVAILHLDDQRDWAILQFNGQDYPTTHVGETVKPGDSVSLLGFPKGREIVDVSHGDTKATDAADGPPYLRLNADVESGQSGGPVFDEKGRVVGIVSANERSGHEFHIAVPIDPVVAVLRTFVPPKAPFWSEPTDAVSITQPNIRSKNAYGLKLNSVHWYNEYKADGDFTGFVEYDVTNSSSFSLIDLLPDKAGWFGAGIKAELKYEILSKDKPFHSLSESSDLRFDREERFYGGTKTKSYFLWLPRISPPLKPGERIKYGVTIRTKRTEMEAFSDQGSFAGMATQ